MNPLRIASRQSPLALRQTAFVKTALERLYPHLEVTVLGLTTEGDRHLETRLDKIGGKGLFVKELQTALLDGRADIAVHSVKDMTTTLPAGLILGAICAREDPRDAFISNRYQNLADLAPQAVIGTSSLRRETQLRALHADVKFQPIRGNVNSRLQKLDQNRYDAIILAVAGLIRLGLEHRITQILSTDDCLPAVGQGALGIECRANDEAVLNLIQKLDHKPTHHCIVAERAMNRALGGDCHTPVSGYAVFEHGYLTLRGRIQSLHSTRTGPAEDAEHLGLAVANELLAKGAKEAIRNA